MTARDWAFLGCRLMALWLGVTGLVSMPGLLIQQAMMKEYPEMVESGLASKLFSYAPVMHLLILFAAVVILFFGARLISANLVPDSEESAKPLTRRGIVTVGSTLLGAYFGLTYLPSLIVNVYERFSRTTVQPGETLSVLVANAAGVAVSLCLLLYSYFASRTEPETGP